MMLLEILYRNNFGEVTLRQGRIIEEYTRGYENPSGSWSSTPINRSSKPCTFLKVIWKGKRKPVTITKSQVLKIGDKVINEDCIANI